MSFTSPMGIHLHEVSSQSRTYITKDGESVKDYVKRFNQAILEVEDASNKVVVMAMMEGLQQCPLLNSLSRNVLETQSALQSKVDKYISVEELAEAKRRRRERDDYERKEPDSKRYGNNKPIAVDIQVINGGFGLGECPSSSRKRHAGSASELAGEEFYNLSSPAVGAHQPITFTNNELRGLHLPHDDILVISTTIANFNVQRILIDNGSSADILFISAFDKMKMGEISSTFFTSI
ncbi:hypothetical protein Acr_22g0009900 [Actinidia rufa]|uniref:Retrotransposon gag domain-containing protein n=1 Tax=Actinidia rufa TaxID=165716 RepID=A0A7J0GLF1_9ERIC|nr:hypothetical protein Acr_22g0009900 [Actinidia rufa]